MNIVRKLVVVDGENAKHAANEAGLQHFPLKPFIDLMLDSGGSDIIETLYTVVERVPENDSAEAVANVAASVRSKTYALEMQGAKVIVCPAKRTANGGFKQSDDQLLQIKTLSACMRLKPDFVTLVSGDDDHSPLVWELREHGIRTEVVAPDKSLGNQLKRASYAHIDLNQVFAKIKAGGAA